MHPFFLQTPLPPAGDTTAIRTFTERIHEMSSMSVDQILKTVTHGVITVGLKLIVAFLVFYIGRWLIRKLTTLLKRMMDHRRVDVTISQFVGNLISVTLYVFLAITVISVLGINTTSLVALFASAGLAVGMALSGTLQNFAGGL